MNYLILSHLCGPTIYIINYWGCFNCRYENNYIIILNYGNPILFTLWQ